jgi:hypothetical protein
VPAELAPCRRIQSTVVVPTQDLMQQDDSELNFEAFNTQLTYHLLPCCTAVMTGFATGCDMLGLSTACLGLWTLA